MCHFAFLVEYAFWHVLLLESYLPFYIARGPCLLTLWRDESEISEVIRSLPDFRFLNQSNKGGGTKKTEKEKRSYYYPSVGPCHCAIVSYCNLTLIILPS